MIKHDETWSNIFKAPHPKWLYRHWSSGFKDVYDLFVSESKTRADYELYAIGSDEAW